MVGFDLGPLLQSQTRIAKVKVLITRLLLILEVYSTKPTHTESLARNFLMLDLTLGPSFKVNSGSLALVSCLFGGYKFASVSDAWV